MFYSLLFFGTCYTFSMLFLRLFSSVISFCSGVHARVHVSDIRMNNSNSNNNDEKERSFVGRYHTSYSVCLIFLFGRFCFIFNPVRGSSHVAILRTFATTIIVCPNGVVVAIVQLKPKYVLFATTPMCRCCGNGDRHTILPDQRGKNMWKMSSEQRTRDSKWNQRTDQYTLFPCNSCSYFCASGTCNTHSILFQALKSNAKRSDDVHPG